MSTPSSSLTAALPCLAVTVLLAGCSAAPQQFEDPFSRRFTQLSLGVGARSYDQVGPDDQAPVFLVDYQEGDRIGPFDLEGGVHYTYDDRSIDTPSGRDELSTQTLEISVGLRGELGRDVFALIPYAGVGGSAVFADVSFLEAGEVEEESDVIFGGYAKAGILLPLRSGSTIGLEVRQLFTDTITLGDMDVDLDATQIALVFGARY